MMASTLLAEIAAVVTDVIMASKELTQCRG